MAKHHQTLIVPPDTKVKLKDHSPCFHGRYDNHKAALPELTRHLEKLDQLQYALYAERTHSLLIVLQGLDAAGKDGVIRHVMTGMNPQGCTVTGFKQPTSEESSHDFLWRVHPHVPRKGAVAIFNRSYYEDVLVTRVHKSITRKECFKRERLINDFETLLSKENGTTILKFFLHLSKEEQLARFRQRLDEPASRWKISESDYKERMLWDKYTTAYEKVLHTTSTEHAPWFVIPSDHKWFRNLAISQIITTTLERLKIKIPRPTVDIAEIRRKFHAAASKGA